MSEFQPGPVALLARAAQASGERPVKLTIAELLAYWGYRRRGFEPVSHISGDLKAAGLRTEPPFENGPIGTLVRLVPIQPPAPVVESEGCESTDEPDDGPVSQAALRVKHALPGHEPDGAATDKPTLISVLPYDTIERAQTLMLKGPDGGYSQLPIIDEAGALRGMISWESLARVHTGGLNADSVMLARERREPEVVSWEADLVEQMPKIIRHGFILVRDGTDKVTGILTTADLADRFHDLAGVYVKLREIELRLRRLIETRVGQDAVTRALSPKKGEAPAVDKLDFGQYGRIFKNLVCWRKLGWNLEQEGFTAELDEIRKIRNEVMHFRPTPLTDKQRGRVTDFAAMLRSLDPHP